MIRWQHLFIGVVFVVVIWFIAMQLSWSATAAAGWSNAKSVRVETSINEHSSGESWHMPGCSTRPVVAERPAKLFSIEACVVERGGVELAVYWAPPSRSAIEYAVKLPGDVNFHYVYEFSYNLLLLDDGRIAGSTVKAGGLFVVSADELEPYITGTGFDTTVKSYYIKPSPSSMVRDGSGGAVHVHRIDVSSGYLFAVARAYGRGGILVDLSTLKATYVSTDLAVSGPHNSNDIRHAVSDDGTIVAVVDSTYALGRLYVVDDDCDAPSFVGPDTSTCHSIDFSAELRDSDMLSGTVPLELSLSTDGSKLFMKSVMGSGGIVETVIVPEYSDARLKYLALGDSISSGEGDIAVDATTESKHYRIFTDNEGSRTPDIPREKCHLSTRSYPYLLARSMNLAFDHPKDWDSIACSGATSSDIYVGSYGFLYGGQRQGGRNGNIPRLEGRSDRATLQASALDRFIPGRIQQIEFVKRYRPEIITLTIGANNIDFGDKLTSCLSSPGDCDWATTKRSALGSQIQGQYNILLSLYRQIYSASGGQTRVYVLGYPQMVSKDESSACGANIGLLSKEERAMIYNATDYLNLVIERAANAAGVMYVDISESLDGGRLCDEGQEYMTGIAYRGSNELQESFHPNDYGHIMIASEVRRKLGGQTLSTYQFCREGRELCPVTDENASKPAIPENLGGAPKVQSKSKRFSPGIIPKGVAYPLTIDPLTLLPVSNVRIELHSDTIDLGQFTASESGGLDVMITIPSSAPVGYHTLVVTGRTNRGEPVEYMQTVAVVGPNNEDINDNGILDKRESCSMFLISLGVQGECEQRGDLDVHERDTENATKSDQLLKGLDREGEAVHDYVASEVSVSGDTRAPEGLGAMEVIERVGMASGGHRQRGERMPSWPVVCGILCIATLSAWWRYSRYSGDGHKNNKRGRW